MTPVYANDPLPEPAKAATTTPAETGGTVEQTTEQLVAEAREFIGDFDPETGNWPACSNAKLISQGPPLILALIKALTAQFGRADA